LGRSYPLRSDMPPERVERIFSAVKGYVRSSWSADEKLAFDRHLAMALVDCASDLIDLLDRLDELNGLLERALEERGDGGI